MSDIVVTVPKSFTHPCAPGKRGLAAWIAEGDPAGEPWSGVEWGFTVAGNRPLIQPGERVYVACENRLRGYSPLIRLEQIGPGYWELIRGGGAVAVTLSECIVGFRGWRRRWWDRDREILFPEWMESKGA